MARHGGERVRVRCLPRCPTCGACGGARRVATATVTVAHASETAVSFMVYEEDTVSDEFLGMATLDTSGLAEHGGTVEVVRGRNY